MNPGTATSEKVVPLREAKREVEVAIARVALLHLSFCKTLVDELGEAKGKELVMRSILEYGKRIGARTERGTQSLPKYGIFETSKDGKIHDCVFAKTFQEYGEENLGGLYCYIDAFQSMAINPKNKLIHTECASVGDEYCTFQPVLTTEKEREAFENEDIGYLKNIDPRLAEGVRKKK